MMGGLTLMAENAYHRPMSIPRRDEITPGRRVAIILKEDQRSGKLTEGVVERLLTRSTSHPYGIKVALTSGHVGRVQRILE